MDGMSDLAGKLSFGRNVSGVCDDDFVILGHGQVAEASARTKAGTAAYWLMRCVREAIPRERDLAGAE